MFSRIILVIAAMAAALVPVGCGADDTATDRTSVVAAFYPLAYAAEQVGGHRVAVTNLTPAGAEPHDFELSAGDVRTVQEADLVLYLGRGFQPALERALEGRDGRSIDLLAGRLPTDAGEKREVDPHLWLDPGEYAVMAQRIADELGDPAAAASLVDRLRGLEREYDAGLEDCRRREIVTSHAAFGYLARRFGLEQVSLTGIEPEAEPTPRKLEELVRLVERSGATTVFFESLVSPELAETVAREAGVATDVLDPLEGLTDEELAEGEDYLTVMRDNLAALRKALDCT